MFIPAEGRFLISQGTVLQRARQYSRSMTPSILGSGYTDSPKFFGGVFLSDLCGVVMCWDGF